MKATNSRRVILSFVIICVLGTAQAGPAAIAADPKTDAQLTEEQMTIKAIKKVLPAVVSITVTGSRTQAVLDTKTGSVATSTVSVFLASGSGFIISSDGLIATNRHVVEIDGANLAYRVVLSNGKRYYAQLIGKDPLNDLAILKIFDTKLPYVELGDSRKLEPGQSVVAIGNALGIYRNSVTKGIISGLHRNIQASDEMSNVSALGNVIQTDAQINPGNSGGPLIDLNGRVVGVNVATEQGAQAISFAIPINDVKPAIKSVRSEQRIVRPRLGIRFVTIDVDLLAEQDLPSTYGALIQSYGQLPAITPGSPAAKIDLREGDIVLEIDGRKLQDQTLYDIVQNYRPGQRIGLRILRDGKIIVRVATLDEFPQ